MSVDITPGSGKTVAADVIGSAAPPTSGQQVQWVKFDIGAAGSSSPVNSSNPLPVVLTAGSAAVGAVTQSGAWAVSLNAGSNVVGGVTQSGTWNVATVTTVTTVAAVTAITNPLPAGTNLIGHIDGAAAAGSAVSGNPVLVGGKDSAGNAQFHKTSSAASTSNVNVPSSNTDAVLTFSAAGAGIAHLLGKIVWSYSGTPTGGRLTVKDGSSVVLDVDVTAAGPGFIPFDKALKGTANTAMEVRLYAGGSGVVGKINAPEKWTE